MNNEYIEFVKSRAKGGDAILLSLTPEKCHLLHMAIGISGEAAEFYQAWLCKPESEAKGVAHMREEAGDLLFYITGATFSLSSWTQDTWADVMRREYGKLLELDSPQALVIEAGNFLDLVKKYTVYNKPFDEAAIVEALKNVISPLLTWSCGQAPKLAEENMTKLLKRYANGYSDKAAQERADKPAGE